MSKVSQINQNINNNDNTSNGKQAIGFANLRAKTIQHPNFEHGKVIQTYVRPQNNQYNHNRINSFDNPQQFYSLNSSPNKNAKTGINPFIT